MTHGQQWLATGRIPKARGAIHAGGQHLFAVMAKTGLPQCATRAVPQKSSQGLAGACVPNPGGGIAASGHDPASVRAERRQAHLVVVAQSLADWSPGLCVPEARRPVVTGRDDAVAVRAEGGNVEGSLVGPELQELWILLQK